MPSRVARPEWPTCMPGTERQIPAEENCQGAAGLGCRAQGQRGAAWGEASLPSLHCSGSRRLCCPSSTGISRACLLRCPLPPLLTEALPQPAVHACTHTHLHMLLHPAHTCSHAVFRHVLTHVLAHTHVLCSHTRSYTPLTHALTPSPTHARARTHACSHMLPCTRH